MKVRKAVAATALAVGLLGGPVLATAGAQESPPEVAPSTTVQVKGNVIPRTGGDFDAEVIVGLGLTAAGAALALAARERRRRYAVQA